MHMSTKMLSKIFIFFWTPHFAAYISAYIRWPVPGGPYLNQDTLYHHSVNQLTCNLFCRKLGKRLNRLIRWARDQCLEQA